MQSLGLTIACALAMGFIFYRLKVPAGILVGSLVGVAILNILTDLAYMPNGAKLMAQILAGTFIAVSLDIGSIKNIRFLMRPAIVIVFGMLLINITIGYMIYLTTPLDLVTAFMSTVPGGMSDVPLISADMGADLPKVAAMQFARLLAAVGIYPTVIAWLIKRQGPSSGEDKEDMISTEQSSPKRTEGLTVVYTLSIATLAGGFGKYLGIPAGALLFSMGAVLVVNYLGLKVGLPKGFKRLAQILSGAYVGSVIHFQDVIEMKHLLFPIALSTISYLLLCVLLGRFLTKHYGIPLGESMLAATPGGSSDMALIASDLGVEVRDVLVLQVVRLIAVVSVFPQVIRIVTYMIEGSR